MGLSTPVMINSMPVDFKNIPLYGKCQSNRTGIEHIKDWSEVDWDESYHDCWEGDLAWSIWKVAFKIDQQLLSANIQGRWNGFSWNCCTCLHHLFICCSLSVHLSVFYHFPGHQRKHIFIFTTPIISPRTHSEHAGLCFISSGLDSL